MKAGNLVGDLEVDTDSSEGKQILMDSFEDALKQCPSVHWIGIEHTKSVSTDTLVKLLKSLHFAADRFHEATLNFHLSAHHTSPVEAICSLLSKATALEKFVLKGSYFD